MTLEEQLAELKKGLETAFETKNKASIAEEIKSFETKFTELESKAKGLFDEELKTVKADFEEKSKGMQEHLDKLDVKFQSFKGGSKNVEAKSFNDVIAETIEAKAAEISNYKPKSGGLEFEMKAVGDMSIGGNFPAATALYQDTRALFINPYERQFLGDILPGGTSSGTQLVYPQENGGEGGVDEWERADGDKPQVDYDFITQTIPFSWIAGIAIVEREMLDDIPWLISYLQNRLLLDLKTKENDFILNRAVTGLIAKATPYSGSFTEPVDRIIDAAWGQIVEDTFDMYSPTHVIVRPREAVKIGLNKASGSGEYDLPQGSVAFANGKLTVGGLDVLGTTSMAANNFLAIDARSTQFIKRLAPELRMFEDAALAKVNKVMFRIEERVALATYAPKALVKGLLEPTT